MIHENFAILGIFITFLSGLDYLISTIKGTVKPNRVTWFLWGLAPIIAFSAQIQQGVRVEAFLTLTVGVMPLLVFFASFMNKKAEWKLHRFDFICGGLSIVGLLLWYITKVGNVAIFFSILADGLAAVPTLVKSYHAPETESSRAFLLNAVGSLIVILAIRQWDFAHYGFPLYVFLMPAILFVLIRFKIGKLLSKRKL